jgi:hypothetical protein
MIEAPKCAPESFIRLNPGTNPTKLDFSFYSILAVNFSHFVTEQINANTIKQPGLKAKMSVLRRKKFGRIDSSRTKKIISLIFIETHVENL